MAKPGSPKSLLRMVEFTTYPSPCTKSSWAGKQGRRQSTSRLVTTIPFRRLTLASSGTKLKSASKSKTSARTRSMWISNHFWKMRSLWSKTWVQFWFQRSKYSSFYQEIFEKRWNDDDNSNINTQFQKYGKDLIKIGNLLIFGSRNLWKIIFWNILT